MKKFELTLKSFIGKPECTFDKIQGDTLEEVLAQFMLVVCKIAKQSMMPTYETDDDIPF